jgi:arabinose-5-phosphate isomerase
MAGLNADCAKLVEAAARLPKAREPAGGAGAGVAGAASAGSGTAASVLEVAAAGAAEVAAASMLADAHALAAAAAAYAQPDPALALALRHLTADLVASSTKGSPAAAAGAAAVGAAGSPHVFVTGVGKSGAVAARMAMSLRSLGVRASFVHGSEWHHGDLGTLRRGDVLISFSHSGRTAELVDVVSRAGAAGVRAYAVTGDAGSPLALAGVGHVAAPAAGELLGRVPTRSVVVQEAAANAVLSAVVAALQLTPEAFKANHPGGAIGAAPAR